MLSLHTWPKWRGPPVEGVSYLVNDLPIPTGEFAFGRTKIFVRSPRSVIKNIKLFILIKLSDYTYFYLSIYLNLILLIIQYALIK